MFYRTCKLLLLMYAALLLYAGWMPLNISLDGRRIGQEFRRALAPSPKQCLGAIHTGDGRKNLLLFVPLGVLFVAAWGGRRKAWWLISPACAAALAVSLAIEAGQLVVLERYADMRDVVMNTLGGLLGAAAAAVLLIPARLGARKAASWQLLPRHTPALRIGILVCGCAFIAALVYLTWSSSGGRTAWPLWGLYRHEFGWAYYATLRRWAVAGGVSALAAFYLSLRYPWPLRYRMLAGAAAGAMCAAALETAKAVAGPHGGSLAIGLENTAAAVCGTLFFALTWRILDRRHAALNVAQERRKEL